MKVQLIATITGTRNGVAWPPPGGVVDLPDLEAAKLCASGQAKPVVEDRVEKAVPADEAETRTSAKRTRSRTPRP